MILRFCSLLSFAYRNYCTVLCTTIIYNNRYVTSWIDKRDSMGEKAQLTLLFDKYIPTLIEIHKNRFKKITPIPEITHIELLCNLLECLITPESVPSDSPKEWIETYFVFAAVWAFGSATYQDQVREAVVLCRLPCHMRSTFKYFQIKLT